MKLLLVFVGRLTSYGPTENNKLSLCLSGCYEPGCSSVTLISYVAFQYLRMGGSIVTKTMILDCYRHHDVSHFSLSCCGKVSKTSENANVPKTIEINSITETKKMGKLVLLDRIKVNFSNLRQVVAALKDGLRTTLKHSITYFKLDRSIDQKGEPEPGDWNLDSLHVYFEFKYLITRMLRISLIMIIPFGQYVAFLLIWKYPTKFVTPYFWTKEQKKQYQIEFHEKRVNLLTSLLNSIGNSKTFHVCPEWKSVLDHVNRKEIPSADLIIKCQSLFRKNSGPLYYENLDEDTIDTLMKIYDLRQTRLVTNVIRVKDQIALFYFSDIYIHINGNVDILTPESLDWLCFSRGMNIHCMTEEEKKNSMREWIEITSKLDISVASYELFLPVLLSLNYQYSQSVHEKIQSSE